MNVQNINSSKKFKEHLLPKTNTMNKIKITENKYNLYNEKQLETQKHY